MKYLEIWRKRLHRKFLQIQPHLDTTSHQHGTLADGQGLRIKEVSQHWDLKDPQSLQVFEHFACQQENLRVFLVATPPLTMFEVETCLFLHLHGRNFSA